MRRVLPLLALVAACGPVSVEQAERDCFERARLAQQPRGTFAVGTSTEGPQVRSEINVSSDFLMGRDPAQVYDSCVQQRSGQLPRTPLYARPDWKG